VAEKLSGSTGPHVSRTLLGLTGDGGMERRTFMALVSGGLLAAPLAAETFSGSCQAIVF
jgi:hypothetical protein